MKRIVTHPQSYIAYVEYHPEAAELYIIMRKDGKKYVIREFTAAAFKKIENAQNKGSYICLNVLRTYQTELVGNVELHDIQMITRPQYRHHYGR